MMIKNSTLKITWALICLSTLILSCNWKGNSTLIITRDKEQDSLDGRDPFAGLYAIWYGNNETVLSSGFLKGGQVMVQWKDCEPEEGKYDFSLLNEKLAQIAQCMGIADIVIENINAKDCVFHMVEILRR